jgi:hypothetical protein
MYYWRDLAMNLKTLKRFVLLYTLAILSLALVSSIALADADVTLSWTPPTQCTNGDAIGATEQCTALTRFALHCGSVSGGPYEWLWGLDAARLTDTRSYADGDYYCVLKARNDGGLSDNSNEIFFTVATPPPTPIVPNPPTSITIEIRAIN